MKEPITDPAAIQLRLDKFKRRAKHIRSAAHLRVILDSFPAPIRMDVYNAVEPDLHDSLQFPYTAADIATATADDATMTEFIKEIEDEQKPDDAADAVSVDVKPNDPPPPPTPSFKTLAQELADGAKAAQQAQAAQDAQIKP